MTDGIPGEPAPTRTDWRVSLIGGMRREGPWTMQPRTLFLSLVGGAHLDLSQALLTSNDLVLTVGSLVGGVDVTVPTDVEVVVQGIRLLGGRSVEPATPPTRATLTIRSYGGVGGVSVRRATAPAKA